MIGGDFMEFYIGETAEKLLPASSLSAARTSDNGLFRSELADAIGRQSESSSDNSGEFPGYCKNCPDQMVIISPKIEEKMRTDPEYSEKLAKKLNELLQSHGKSMRDSVVIVQKNGEISQYCLRPKREPEHPTAEELKEVAKARARRKAKLDAYFHLLERVAIKRKLIEQENAKRLLNKKFRFSVSGLDMMARARQITTPPANPDYFF